jgi:hypothetical protein
MALLKKFEFNNPKVGGHCWIATLVNNGYEIHKDGKFALTVSVDDVAKYVTKGIWLIRQPAYTMKESMQIIENTVNPSTTITYATGAATDFMDEVNSLCKITGASVNCIGDDRYEVYAPGYPAALLAFDRDSLLPILEAVHVLANTKTA